MEAVRSAIASGRGAEAAKTYFAEDATIEVQGAPHVPFVGTFATPADRADFFAHLTASRPEQLSIEKVLVDGEDVVTIGSYRYLVVNTGRRYGGRFALHTVIRDGLISRWSMFEDSWAVAAAFDD